ncbi:sulfatase-like hydrolase/transferase [candidate division KSB1 bacterium]|nr:sulfatase-like hydrolase/transferase [candidate division KSB1 bacterium]
MLKNFFLSLLFLLAAGCAIKTTSRQWKIRWDKEKLARKESLLDSIRNQPTSVSRPNIVLIMADDLGKYEVSAYGSTHIQTPHIDQLAEEGVLFQNAYVTAPICSPSRAAILTGKYQQRYGFESQPMEFYPSNFIEYTAGKNANFLGDWKVVTSANYPAEWEIAKQGIPLPEVNLAELMRAAGYKTAIIGKWHLGKGKTQIPNKRGFDYQYGFYGAFSLYTPSQKTEGYQNFIQDDFSARFQWDMKRRSSAAIRRNNKVVREEEYLTFAIRDQAIDFLEQNRDTSFFLYVPFSAPHVPFQAPQEYYDKFPQVEDKNKRVYYAMIAALDDAIGAIHNKIKALGLEENTIIYFLSDNGGATYTGATDNGPLKGGKITHFEGGINVPFMVKWKGKMPAGMNYDPAVSAMDIFSTAVENCGIELPDSYETDGVNLMPYLTGERDALPHEKLYWRAAHIRAIQTNKWKLILSTRDMWIHLYNLQSDKSETIDLQHENPELLQRLQEYFDSWNSDLPEKPMWPRLMDRRFVIDGKEYYFPA